LSDQVHEVAKELVGAIGNWTVRLATSPTAGSSVRLSDRP
jgi:hypothetical protein